VLGVAFIVIWLGVRPLTRALLDQQTAGQVAGGALAVEGAGEGGGAAGDAIGSAGSAATAAIGAILRGGGDEPNLIEDITGEVRNVSQKRLEQMVVLDEEQAASILKQWMRERAA
jgi:flagellar M-ring protein FliF